MYRVLIGAVVAGIAMFLWGFVFWGISSFPYSALSRTADDVAAGQALMAHLPQTGTYLIPGQHNPPEIQRKLFEGGPVAMVFFNRGGKPMMSALQMVQGLLHSTAVALVVGIALSMLGGTAGSYAERVRTVAIIGLAAAMMVPIGNIIWWYYPPSWELWNVLYLAVSWLIMGLVLAYFVRPRTS